MNMMCYATGEGEGAGLGCCVSVGVTDGRLDGLKDFDGASDGI
jgi:hypothetical protein